MKSDGPRMNREEKLVVRRTKGPNSIKVAVAVDPPFLKGSCK